MYKPNPCSAIAFANALESFGLTINPLILSKTVSLHPAELVVIIGFD